MEKEETNMRYLFFDIECADGGQGSICSFGYVITDTDFHVLEKRDIVINPDARFHLAGRSKRPDLVLAYTKEEFRKEPKFPHFYEEIRAMLEAEDQVVVGHSVRDDVNFLCKACRRYALPSFTFSFRDSQRMYADYVGTKDQISLDNACEAFDIEKPHDVHKSDDDAFATMQLVQALCRETGTPLHEYGEKCKCSGTLEGFTVKCDYLRAKLNVERDAEGYRILPEGKENCIWHGTKNEAVFLDCIKKMGKMPRISDLFAKTTVSISLNYERSHFREMLVLVQAIASLGGKYTTKAATADIFVTVSGRNRRGKEKNCFRLLAVQEAQAKGKPIELIPFEQFLAMIALSEEELSAIAESLDI